MKNVFLTVLFITIFSLGYSQNIIVDNLTGFVKENRLTSVTIEMIGVNDTLEIEKVTPIFVATGFLVVKSNIRYTITNDHVTREFDKNKIILIGLNTEKGKVYEIAKLYKSDELKDVSVLINSEMFLSKLKAFDFDSLKQLGVGISRFEEKSSIIEGLRVFTIGYPLNIGATIYNNQPVIRAGIVAQAPQTNGFFLLDGMSNPGNSGSPVYNQQNGKLIGMISNGPQDYINAFDERGYLIVKLPYNSGLTYCVLSDEILKLLP